MNDSDAARVALGEPIDAGDGTWRIETRSRAKAALSARVEGAIYDAVVEHAAVEGIRPSLMVERLLKEALGARASTQPQTVSIDVATLHRALDQAVRESAA